MQFSVNIDEIREKGLDYDRDLPHAFLEDVLHDAEDQGFHAVGGGHFRGHFTKLSGRVLLDAQLEATVTGPCKRCLTDVERKVTLDFTLTWVPEKPDVGAKLQKEIDESADQEGEAKGSFDLAEADTEIFDGETIALDGVLREQLLLNLPLDVVCKDDCKGLCATCGQDLNVKDCGHEQKVPDPRWSALKDIKLPN